MYDYWETWKYKLFRWTTNGTVLPTGNFSEKTNTFRCIPLFSYCLPKWLEYRWTICLITLESLEPQEPHKNVWSVVPKPEKPGALSNYTENQEILVGKSNGTYHSIWNVSEIMGHRLNQCNFLFFLSFPTNTSTFCGLCILHLDKLQHWILKPTISTRMDRVNGKRPRTVPLVGKFSPFFPDKWKVLKRLYCSVCRKTLTVFSYKWKALMFSFPQEKKMLTFLTAPVGRLQ